MLGRLVAFACLIPLGCESPGKYDACAGKSCGETCTQCAPDDPNCEETEEVKSCDPNGVCIGAPVECGGGTGDGESGGEDSSGDGDGGGDGDGFDPCEDKVCGDPCSVCPPDDPECVETGEEKACDPSGDCVSDTGQLCGDGDGDAGDGDGTTAGCTPFTEDASALDTDCTTNADCPPAYTCQGFSGFVFVQSCQILCTQDCECPTGLGCITVSDKGGSWTQCG